MKLNSFYQKVVDKGIEADIRNRREIAKLLKTTKERYDRLSKEQKKYFDTESFHNPFSDTRILYGNPQSNVKSIMVGIDVDAGELLCVDRLREKGKKIDLVVSHHPQGRAYARFYDVMDLQVDMFTREGVSLSSSENLLQERKQEVARKVNAANHFRSVDIARLLNINFLCMHTPCDNLAHQHLRHKIDKANPSTLKEVMDILYTVPEYVNAAENNNPPRIAIGSKNSRCKKIHIGFTGGTEGPQKIYKKLSSCGVDTIIVMHQSEEHFKKCKQFNLNVIFASHIASDSLGINLMLDYLEKGEKLSITEFSGFRRFPHKLRK